MSDIYTLFEELDRCGPGDAASLARILAQVPPGARILDAGCGTGADLPQLAAHGAVIGIDTSARFVEIASARGFDVRQADMLCPPCDRLDLIWSAGAIYNVGISQALNAWRRVLAPGGRVAFSDLCWTRPEVPEGLRAHWAAEGLNPSDAATLEAQVQDLGWRVVDAFWLGPEGWAAYYQPVAVRLAQGGLDPDVVAEFSREIALWQDSDGAYDYRIILCEPA